MTRKILIFIFLSLFLLSGSNVQATEKEKRTKELKLSSIGKTEKPSVRIEKRGDRNYVVGTVLIDAKPESIWDVLVDYPHAPQVFKNLKLCEVVGQRGQTRLVRQLVNTGSPIKFDYTVALVERKPYSIEWSRDSGSLKEVAGTWQLEPLDSGRKTKVTYSIFIDGGIFLPPWLLAPQLKGYLPVVLDALRDKVSSDNARNSEAKINKEERQLSL
jgi:ribosome-associated toxin RatA of RatAB toxin-antitoxin module